MVRGILLLAKIALIVAAALYIAEYPGRVSIDWQGWRMDMSVGLLGFLLLSFVVVAVIFARLFSGTLAVPGRFMANRRSARRERGYKALTQGLVAVAAGDPAEARRLARKAETLLEDPPLTRLLTAQAAQLEGDAEAARKYFSEMLDDPETAFLGTRGLLRQAVSDGDRGKATELAEKAFTLRPGTSWAARHLLDLQQESGDWDGALKTITVAMRHKAIPDTEGKRMKAKLLIGRAREQQSAGNYDEALKLSNQAVKLAGDLAEAVTMSARLLARRGKAAKAVKLLEEAWRQAPDPSISRAYRDVAPQGATALSQVTRFEHLLSLNPDHPESHVALAEAALDAELWGEARSHLEPYVEENGVPDPRVCRLMAQLEEAEHADLEKARYWLAKATGEESAIVA